MIKLTDRYSVDIDPLNYILVEYRRKERKLTEQEKDNPPMVEYRRSFYASLEKLAKGIAESQAKKIVEKWADSVRGNSLVILAELENTKGLKHE